MRRRTRVWLAASLVGAVLGAAVLAPAQSDGNLQPNGGFESGTSNWVAGGATLTVSTSVPRIEGANAALLTSTSAGTISLTNQYWNVPAIPGHTYTLTASLLDNEAQVLGAQARFAVLGAGDVVLQAGEASLAGADSPSFRTATASAVAPPGALYVRVTLTALASAAGAHLSVDDVRLTTTPPISTPTPTPPPPLPPPPVAEVPEEVPPPATATSTPTPRATATRTPTPIPTPTPTPAPLPGLTLRNADFAQGVAGWSVTRGRISTASILDGLGPSLLLTAEDSATVWVQQTVAVTPRGWFAASALLAPLDGIEAAWVRIAWYASPDGSGAQLSTEDSPATTSNVPTAIVRSVYEVVSTGPVQAPAEAHSARVRVLLRAATERGATVVVDEVAFGPSEPGEAAPPSPAARAQATPAPTSTPGPATTPRAPNATPQPSEDAPALVSELTPRATSNAATAAQRRLRITEILSDPGESGADGDFEWVEVMNTGSEPTTLAGISLRDRRTGNVLPPYSLDPGAVVVIAAPGAKIPEGVPLIRLRRAIGNGLGNTGDRVALVGADGREIDAVAYGEGAEDGDEPLPAPGPGQSLERRFSPAGILLEARLTEAPTPGIAPEAAPNTSRTPSDDTPSATSAFSGIEGLAPSWLALLALAGGLLLGAGAARAASVARGRDVEA